MPFQSRAQQRFAFGTGQPWAKRWAKETTFAGLPEHKDAGTVAGAPAHGPGGLLSTPGLGQRARRKGRKWGMRVKDAGYSARAGETIRGNLGRSASGQFTRAGGPAVAPSDAPPTKKPRTSKRARAAKPKQTDAQRQEARDAKRQQNTADVAKRMAETDTGLSPSGVKALTAFASGVQPDAQSGAGLAKMGLAEQASDGSYRMTPTGRAAVSAMAAGDYRRAVDAVSRGTDASGKRTQRQIERTARQQASAAKRQEAEAKRQARREEVAARRAAKKPAKAASDGGKKPSDAKKPAEQPVKAPAKRAARSSGARMPSGGGGVAGATPEKKPQPEKAPSKQISPALAAAATAISEGTDVSDEQISALVRNGLVKLNKDGEPVLTAAGLRATMKAQTPEDRAMFAKMGGGGGGGSGGGAGSKGGGSSALWSKGDSGKRQPTRAQAESHYEHKRSQVNQAVAQSKADVTAAQDKFRTALRGVDKIDPDSPAGKRKLDKIDRLRDDFTKAKKRHTQAAEEQRKIWDEGLRPYDIQQKSFVVFKDASGAMRWVARTTTAYRDRDGEIISEAALDQDSQRMMATKQFGPLRWWHVGDPDPSAPERPWGPGLDIGDCDYSVVIGRTRVESGTFRDPGIARKVAAAADALEMSPGFFHPLDQPDAAGVFGDIRTFERSVVPIRYGRASNLFTGFTVKEFRMDINEMEKRFKAMISEIGLSAEQAASLGDQLVATEKAASAQGIAYKDAEPEYPDLEINGVVYKAFPPKAAEPDAGATTAELKAPPAVEEVAEDVAVEAPEGEMDMEPEGDYIGDMAVEEFKMMLAELLAPVLKMQDMVKSMQDMGAELKTMYGGVTTKDAGVQAEIASLKARLAEIEGDQPATILPDEVAAALKSAPAQAQEPAKPQIESTPDRPWRGWGAQTFPELYQNGENA